MRRRWMAQALSNKEVPRFAVRRQTLGRGGALEESEEIGVQEAGPERKFRVVLIVAAVVSAMFAVPALLLAIQTPWLGGLMLVIEAAIFAFFYYLARRYWIGLLFVPPLVYMVLGSAVGLLAFLPTSEVITLVK